jgi:hypothetical protein
VRTRRCDDGAPEVEKERLETACSFCCLLSALRHAILVGGWLLFQQERRPNAITRSLAVLRCGAYHTTVIMCIIPRLPIFSTGGMMDALLLLLVVDSIQKGLMFVKAGWLFVV